MTGRLLEVPERARREKDVTYVKTGVRMERMFTVVKVFRRVLKESV